SAEEPVHPQVRVRVIETRGRNRDHFILNLRFPVLHDDPRPDDRNPSDVPAAGRTSTETILDHRLITGDLNRLDRPATGSHEFQRTVRVIPVHRHRNITDRVVCLVHVEPRNHVSDAVLRVEPDNRRPLNRRETDVGRVSVFAHSSFTLAWAIPAPTPRIASARVSNRETSVALRTPRATRMAARAIRTRYRYRRTRGSASSFLIFSITFTRLSLLGLNRFNQEFDHGPNFGKLLLKLVGFLAQLVNIGSSTEPASRGVLRKAVHGRRGALLNTHLLAARVAQLHAVSQFHVIHFLQLARHVFGYVASLDGHVQPVRVDLSCGPLLVADNLGGRNPVVLRQSRRATAIRLQLLLRPRVTSRTRMLSLNTDRVDIPGQ